MDSFFCYIVFLCCFSFLRARVLPDNGIENTMDDLFRLDIVHYNDFHDRFEETSLENPVCQSNSSACLGGFPRLYYEVIQLLAEKPGSLLLNAGDSFQGTYWYSLLKWKITQKFMNLLPHDAFAIGNHEFDDGIKGIVPYLAGLNAPIVAANMDASKEPSMEGLFRPHVILHRGGKKIGVIGLITTETASSSSPEGVIFTDPLEAAKKEAKLLTEEGIDIVIVLSHCGLDVDKQIALDYGEYIDLIVGGHSHSLLWNGSSPSNEPISGPYPVLIESNNNPGHHVLIVTASAFTKYVGNLTVWFDKKGEIKDFDGSPVLLNRSIPEDPHIKELLQPYADKLHLLVQEVVGETYHDLLGKTCGYSECTLGNIIADSLLEAGQTRHPSNVSQVSLLLRNNIRGSISKGPITRGVVITTVPFTNKVMALTVKGRHLKEAFEHCLVKFWTEKPFNGPWMPQISGMRLTYNHTKPLGHRVASVYIKEGHEYIPMESDRDYELVTYEFIAKGGNDFEMFKKYGENRKIIGTDAEVLEEYIRKHTPLNPVLESRITVVS